MNAITINNALIDFQNIVENTVNNFEKTVIVSDVGSVVLISQNEWNSIVETTKLLKDKKSLKALIDGHSERQNNDKSYGKTIQEAFYDIQDIDS